DRRLLQERAEDVRRRARVPRQHRFQARLTRADLQGTAAIHGDTVGCRHRGSPPDRRREAAWQRIRILDRLRADARPNVAHALGGAVKSLLKITYSISHCPFCFWKTHRNLPRSRRDCPSFGDRFRRKSPLAYASVPCPEMSIALISRSDAPSANRSV